MYFVELLNRVQFVGVLGENGDHLLMFFGYLHGLYNFDEAGSSLRKSNRIIFAVASDIFDERGRSPRKIDCDFH